MIDLEFPGLYKNYDKLFTGSVIDLSEVSFFDPLSIGYICLKVIEMNSKKNLKIILPKNRDAKSYLRRAHFNNFLKDIGVDTSYLDPDFMSEVVERDNLNVYELSYCPTSDVFKARLPRLLKMLQNFGMNEDNAGLATALVGELGNNAFDHNIGNWPTDVHGAIIIGQRYPYKNKLKITVADPGIGFKASLHRKDPNLKSEAEAIKLALEKGVSGRIEEKRGNGLKFIQDSTFQIFSGVVLIQSYDGLVIRREDKFRSGTVNPILGSVVNLTLNCKKI